MQETGLEHYDDKRLIDLARNTWMSNKTPSEIGELLSGEPSFISDFVRDQDIIEIGCGCPAGHNSVDLIKPVFGARNYTGVDIRLYDKASVNHITTDDGVEHRVEFIESDALSVLVDQPGDSAVIVGNFVFNEPLDPCMYEGAEVKKEYLTRVLREIYRVTPSYFFGLSFGLISRDVTERTGFQEDSAWKDEVEGFREFEETRRVEGAFKGLLFYTLKELFVYKK